MDYVSFLYRTTRNSSPNWCSSTNGGAVDIVSTAHFDFDTRPNEGCGDGLGRLGVSCV